MKHISSLIYISIFLFSSLTINAKSIIEKSSENIPEWLNNAPKGYLVVSANASTIGEAQIKIQELLFESIIQSIAGNIIITESNETSNITIGKDAESKSNYHRYTKIKSANIPYIKNVSLSDVEETYWIKIINKKTKQYYYEYYVKYPFPEERKQYLIAEFERIDSEKSQQFKSLEQKINNIESAGEIKDAIVMLEALETYYFDDVRLSEVQGLKKRYKSLYNNFSVIGKFIAPGKYYCEILLNGNHVNVSAVPKVKSSCARILSVTPQNGAFIISYDAIDCLPDEDNTIELIFNIDGTRLKRVDYISEYGGAGIN